jgi:hypothetical protein
MKESIQMWLTFMSFEEVKLGSIGIRTVSIEIVVFLHNIALHGEHA